MAKKVLTHHLSTPLSRAAAAKVEINLVDGNLSIDSLSGGEPMLASGELQYLESQGAPTQSVTTNSGQTTLTLRSGSKGQPWIRFPWSACNAATLWQIQLNPSVSLEIQAHTGGGNVHLDLTGLAVTRLSADTGGGNMEIILPDRAAGLRVDAKTGAGNLVVHLPGGIAARIQATSGLGKVIVDPRFHKINDKTYQTPDYAGSANPVEITLSSGAGNVNVKERAVQVEAAASRI